MRYLKIVLVAILLLTSHVTFSQKSLKQLPHIFYVTIPVQTDQGLLNISAQYRLPRNATEKLPAVLILHSSSGVDSTGSFYAEALNSVGVATLELDLWGGRELRGGSADRPSLPQQTLPDTFAALEFLANREEIDSEKIAVIGFSWGGVLSMLTATEQYMAISGSTNRFVAHVAHYPVCWVYNNVPGFEFSDLTGSPVLIQTGGLDDYDLPDSCPNLVYSLDKNDKDLISLKVYANAYHAWDRLEPKWVVEDPFSHLGQGGLVTLLPNKRIANRSKKRVIQFLHNIFNK